MKIESNYDIISSLFDISIMKFQQAHADAEQVPLWEYCSTSVGELNCFQREYRSTSL